MTEKTRRAAPHGQSPGEDRHETVVVLPDGTVHTQGLQHRSPETADVRLNRVRAALTAVAIQRQQRVLISTAHPDGRAEHQRVTADGTLEPTVPPLPRRGPLAPEWSEDIPEGTGLLETVRAAHRARQWPAAQQAACRATEHLIARHGAQHPYPVMGLELEAYFAGMAQSHGLATVLYTEAALAVHRLNGPRVQARQDLAHALSAWLAYHHSQPAIKDTRLGFGVAHTLLRITPGDQPALAAVLHRLAQDLR